MHNKWFLESYLGRAENLQRIPLSKFPIQVGRDPNIAIPIINHEISRVHAEFIIKNDDLILCDLNSTNGSFVNYKKLTGETTLQHGDIVHFANHEVRVLLESSNPSNLGKTIVQDSIPQLSKKLPTGLSELQFLLDTRAIEAEFQPIVDLKGNLFAFEVLGRGSRQDLPKYPLGLFKIAESLPGKDAELSLLMRNCGVEQSSNQSNVYPLFMNTHPAEIRDIKYLLDTLDGLRNHYGDIPLVLEIHEDAVTDITQMKKLSRELKAMDIDLAYDDFGSGQARLIEMIEVPVKYVKFDIALIHGLHYASKAKQKLVAALVAMTKDMGIQALAEGVENAEELAVCEQMEFDLIQGFFFGRPKTQLDYVNPLG